MASAGVEKYQIDTQSRRQKESREGGSKIEEETPRARRFHGSVGLNPVRLGRSASDMANEIVQHLMKQPGAKVEITLEIQAKIPNGAPDDRVRTVSELSHAQVHDV